MSESSKYLSVAREYISPYNSPRNQSPAHPTSGYGSRPSSQSGARPSSRSSNLSNASSGVLSPLKEEVVLGRVRVLDQSAADPTDTIPLPSDSRRFRLAVFVFHFGLCMLETPEGTEALVDTGRSIWDTFDRREKRDLRYQQDFQQDASAGGSRGKGSKQKKTTAKQEEAEQEGMERAVSEFLGSLRANPPNIILSTRVCGEGMTRRMNWRDEDSKRKSKYNAKKAASFNLNYRLFKNAIKLADSRYLDAEEEFQRLLFLLGVAVAHELVHMFVGFMSGNEGTNTPNSVQWPFRQPGASTGREAGNAWEGLLMGFNIQANYNPTSPFGSQQAGHLIGFIDNKAYEIGHDWVKQCLGLGIPMIKSGTITRRSKTMEDHRGMPTDAYFSRDHSMTDWFADINSMPLYNITMGNMEEIGRIYDHPSELASRRTPPSTRRPSPHPQAAY
ncbi:hypothetical protein QBC44DRAFT_375362 [Cladorrhinum sp. PSN332]|nr:hypothetical protein QBC44DRAFT_375362 [Cladorrhinum sp. PSN332]